MASSYLVVHIESADVPSSSNATSATCYYCVELRFNGLSVRTEMKGNPTWNRPVHFPMREQQVEDGDHRPSGGLDLEAAVYSIDETSNSESLVGKAVVYQKDFESHSSKAGFFRHDLVKTSGGGGHPECSRVVNGKLNLKVFYSTGDDKALFEIEGDNRDRQDGGAVNKIYTFLFSNKGHRYGDGDADNTSSVVVGNTSLRPGADGVVLREINPSFERGKVVEPMQFLFVLVVKARELPDVDAYGGLDPFVEVSFGARNKGFTKVLKRDENPEWNKTFVFSLPSGNNAVISPGVDVVVKDKDELRDESVGKLYFYLQDIPVRNRDDAQPEPTWHPLLDQSGKATLGKASLLLAIWIGSQADEAYRHAWKSPYGPKVYENPRLWCLRVTIVEVQGVFACDEDEAAAGARSLRIRDKLFCRACLGGQARETRLASKTDEMTSSGRYEWEEEELVFVAAQPFFESKLEVYVVTALESEQDDGVTIAQLSIPLARINKRASANDYERLATLTPQWFDLKNPSPPGKHPHLDGSADEAGVSHMQIRLRSLLDGGYHIGSDPQGYMDDTRPAESQLWEPPIARVHLGILRATGLQNMATGNDPTSSDGRNSATDDLKPYCVAKYGDKWVRTRTITDSFDHVFNEEYAWDVYDIATVLNVGVFDHCSLKAGGAHHGIGKVRVHLSSLETDRIHAHAYPLVTLSSSGVIRTGELHLAVKISSPSTMNMLRMYARPTLPRMHYELPLEEEKEDFFSTKDTAGDKLWSDAANILATRLERMEPPLRREVVDYLCNAESCNSSSWSLRRSKANFFRLTSLFSLFVRSSRWFTSVSSWRNPLVTLAAHAMLVLALWFHELVVPLVLVCVSLLGLWNYRIRPRKPPYIDPVLSHIYLAHPDELDEEFDTRPGQRGDDLVRMRYDRLRSVAGRIQTIMDDVATNLERIRLLLSWRDPRVTAIFMLFLLVAAATVYFVPYKLLVALAGFYIMRHPRLRRPTNMPSILENFFRRLPSRQYELM